VPVKTRFDDVIRRIAEEGEWGAMVLTEPGAGSDLAKLTSKATPVDAGNDKGPWRLSGQKIFITAGHGDHHVVIARTEDEAKVPGLKGLSLLYVPKWINADGQRCRATDKGARRNFTIGGVEHKMGQHSAVAATIHYEDSVAELIGKRGEGFAFMLTLMNNARVGVAMEAIGTCEAAYRMAKDYAEQRHSMGKAIGQHEMIADYLDEMDVSIRALRAITFEAAYHEEVSSRLKMKIKLRPSTDATSRADDEKQLKRSRRKARHLTPLIKYFGGEECVRQARMCMQILGGIGYVKETGAEKILRDALVIPVYEGTSQIQALMALKDNLQGVIRNPARFLSEVARVRLDALSHRDPLLRGVSKLRTHALSAMQNIVMRIAADKLGDVKGKPMGQWRKAFMQDWNPQTDFAYGMLHAERLTKLLTYAAMARTLLQHAEEAKGTPDEASRRELAIRFVERFEPKAHGVLIEIESMGPSVLARVMPGHKRSAKIDDAAQ
jgi:alkylation response protein AidB-like acyl-CoA dehydrogenase